VEAFVIPFDSFVRGHVRIVTPFTLRLGTVSVPESLNFSLQDVADDPVPDVVIEPPEGGDS